MEIDMENEIKTFVYRTEQIKKEAYNRLFVAKKHLVAVFIAMFAVIASLVSVPVVMSESASCSDPEQSSEIVAVSEMPGETVFEVAADVEDTVSEREYTEKDSTVTIAAAQQEVMPLPSIKDIEVDDEVMLLGLDDEDAGNSYIPADIGSKQDTSSQTTEPAYSSKIEEVEAKAEDATTPKDIPTKLTYTYNQNMIIDPDDENRAVLERIVEAEANDEDIYGKMLVANVVINRVNEGFADTIKGVVFQRLGGSAQFSPVVDGRYYSITVTQETKDAVARVLAGEDYSQGALYFFMRSGTTRAKAAWFDNELKYLFKYGCHEFFDEK